MLAIIILVLLGAGIGYIADLQEKEGRPIAAAFATALALVCLVLALLCGLEIALQYKS